MKMFRIFIGFLAGSTSLFFLQCTKTQEPAVEGEMKAIYIDQFKLTYFRKMLVRSFNNSAAIREVISQDHSGFTEIILTMEDYQLLDSLTIIHTQTIKSDSVNSIGRVAEGAEGKHPFHFILDKMGSKWLDSLARKRYERSGVN